MNCGHAAESSKVVSRYVHYFATLFDGRLRIKNDVKTMCRRNFYYVLFPAIEIFFVAYVKYVHNSGFFKIFTKGGNN